MRITAQSFFSAAILIAAGSSVQAQILTGSCSVVIHNEGKITLNAGGTELSSKNGGGQNVRATVTSNAGLLCTLTNLVLCYGVSAPPPLLFSSSPLDGSLGTVFSSLYRVNSGAEVAGATRTPVTNGTYNLTVELAASKVVGSFGAGDYRGEVLVRCE